MPIKGIIFLLLIAVVIGVAFNKPVYTELKNFFTDKKEEDKEE